MIRTQSFIKPEQTIPTILTGRSDQPQPFIIRQDQSRPSSLRSQPPRPTMVMQMQSESPRPTALRPEQPRPMMTFGGQNPFLNLFRGKGPIMIRSQSIPLSPQALRENPQKPVNISPPEQQLPAEEDGPIVTKENPNGPTIIGFSLPQLLSRVNNIIPRMDKVSSGPRVMEISVRNPFRDFQRPSMSLPELPRMLEGMFGHKDEDIEPIIEEALFGDDEEEDFLPESIFGRKDDDVEPFGGFEGLFEQINSQVGRLMSSMPHQVIILQPIKKQLLGKN